MERGHAHGIVAAVIQLLMLLVPRLEQVPGKTMSYPRAHDVLITVETSVALDDGARPIPATCIPVWLDPIQYGFDELISVRF